MKSTILWIIILILSVNTVILYNEKSRQKEARQRFYEKAEQIFYRVYYGVEDGIEGKSDEQLSVEVNTILDMLMIEKDHDYLTITQEEKDNFLWNMANVARLAAKELNGKPVSLKEQMGENG